MVKIPCSQLRDNFKKLKNKYRTKLFNLFNCLRIKFSAYYTRNKQVKAVSYRSVQTCIAKDVTNFSMHSIKQKHCILHISVFRGTKRAICYLRLRFSASERQFRLSCLVHSQFTLWHCLHCIVAVYFLHRRRRGKRFSIVYLQTFAAVLNSMYKGINTT